MPGRVFAPRWGTRRDAAPSKPRPHRGLGNRIPRRKTSQAKAAWIFRITARLKPSPVQRTLHSTRGPGWLTGQKSPIIEQARGVLRNPLR
jgi:hypothetical protein